MVAEVGQLSTFSEEALQRAGLTANVVLANRAGGDQHDARMRATRSQVRPMQIRKVPRIVRHDCAPLPCRFRQQKVIRKVSQGAGSVLKGDHILALLPKGLCNPRGEMIVEPKTYHPSKAPSDAHVHLGLVFVLGDQLIDLVAIGRRIRDRHLQLAPLQWGVIL